MSQQLKRLKAARTQMDNAYTAFLLRPSALNYNRLRDGMLEYQTAEQEYPMWRCSGAAGTCKLFSGHHGRCEPA